jgi:hypothetical protein
MHKLYEFLDYLRDQPVIRERDDEGRLLAAGFKWSEPVEWVQLVFGIGAFVLVFYALAGSMDRRTPPDAAFFVGLGAAASVLICILCGSIERGIAFQRDGRVRVLGGWSNWFDLYFRLKEHAYIASIEIVKTQFGTGVAILTTGGGTIMLSQALSEPAARLAAVQLTIALREMRTELTSIHNFQHLHQAPSAPQAWID